ncbi:DUF1656 domain-containing protein [Oleisolibacter albus]|uniref:DUF1656 domain-containing protein n=1 Tax=Oleisolibacter albus TaxID=2171757 RepID=UPI000DF42F7D|nr:DUF1656 domain-containing protein [Oleisolibacter albus]
MSGDVDLLGVFLPPLLVAALPALFLTGLLRRLLRRADLYRFVWHQPLFDFALLVLMLGFSAAALSHLAGFAGPSLAPATLLSSTLSPMAVP